MTQYPVSPEDQPTQSRDMFVPEHASATPAMSPDPGATTAPSAAQTEAPEAEEAETSIAEVETKST